MASTGVVVRFDAKRGYGFINPDDGSADVFVHQNNINMEGFRYLRVGERVQYELEVGEKGMKAVGVDLLDPRPPQDERGGYDRDDRDDYDRDDRRDRDNGYDRGGSRSGGGGNDRALDQMRRKQERLISLLVEKGILAPGEIDGLEGVGSSLHDDDLDDHDDD